jgi:homoserine kinase type II
LPIVHADLFRDNVLWRADGLAALLDFESASSGSPAFDLAVVLLAWCFGDGLDLELGRALVAGYLARRPMPEEEREELYEAALFAALRFTISRITDFELRPRGRGVFKDFRRFVARMRAIEEIGERSFRGALGM